MVTTLKTIFNTSKQKCSVYDIERDKTYTIGKDKDLANANVVVPWLHRATDVFKSAKHGLKITLNNGHYTYLWEDGGYILTGPVLGQGSRVQKYSKAGQTRTLVIGSNGISVMGAGHTVVRGFFQTQDRAQGHVQNSASDVTFSQWHVADEGAL